MIQNHSSVVTYISSNIYVHDIHSFKHWSDISVYYHNDTAGWTSEKWPNKISCSWLRTICRLDNWEIFHLNSIESNTHIIKQTDAVNFCHHRAHMHLSALRYFINPLNKLMAEQIERNLKKLLLRNFLNKNFIQTFHRY